MPFDIDSKYLISKFKRPIESEKMYWLNLIILLNYQTHIFNAKKIKCYTCEKSDDIPMHWRTRKGYSIKCDNTGSGIYYPPKCNASEIESIGNLKLVDCDKSCGVVKLTKLTKELTITTGN